MIQERLQTLYEAHQLVEKLIQLNPRYEAIFNPDNIDQDCDRIAGLMNDEVEFIKDALDAGLYKQTVTMKAASKQEQCELAQTLPSVKVYG